MRTISWTKQPLIILFAAAIAAGCGSDSKPAASADAGLSKKCGDGVIDTGEECDKTALGGKNCSTALMSGSTGTLTCSSTCKLVTTACSKPAGSGGAVSAGGASAGGAAQGGKGGNGGKKPKTDAGTDSGSGGTSGTDASVDASKKD